MVVRRGWAVCSINGGRAWPERLSGENGRLLLRQLEGTKAEMALAVTAYNFKRAISVLGAKKMMQLMG